MSPRIWPPALNWKASTHWDYEAEANGTPGACVLCGKPSLLLSTDGVPCHKVCAEGWFEQHPQAWAAYETQRDQPKTAAQMAAPQASDPDNGLFDQAA
ncbi:hypothetical protein [Streptomyces sp. WAC06128]|uniref:hypothetical protein n=1 Tax=Streptomyces sp. WAC06128 TaxID=2487426 RepID=UPI00163C70C8|nr:hypothetical protein [Streptomyces sp. WAC06128]